MTDVIDHDLIYPRDDLHRFRLYGRTTAGLTVLAAAPDLSSVGVAIGQIHADIAAEGETLGDLGQTGIYNAIDRKWIVSPFTRST